MQKNSIFRLKLENCFIFAQTKSLENFVLQGKTSY